MNTRDIVRQAQFAIACIVTSCVFLISGARAQDVVKVSGKAVNPNGEPIGGVGIRVWERGNLSQEDATATSDEGDFSLAISPQAEAILLHGPNIHIGVRPVPRTRSGSLNWGEIVMYPTDHATSALSFSQIANGYAQLALLASSTDEFTRKFIVFEFDNMRVAERLRRLNLPSDSSKEVDSELRGMRDRILRKFDSLRGNNARQVQER
jgi:hypothetical protein